jgi:excinuclease ABC subunit C
MASLAKENEEVFIPGNPEPVRLPKDSPALHILQRARDEAHRFAISYHRRLRHREAVASALDGIPGIGPRRKRTLLRRFGSIEAIRQASLDELGQTDGITPALAKIILQELTGNS